MPGLCCASSDVASDSGVRTACSDKRSPPRLTPRPALSCSKGESGEAGELSGEWAPRCLRLPSLSLFFEGSRGTGETGRLALRYSGERGLAGGDPGHVDARTACAQRLSASAAWPSPSLSALACAAACVCRRLRVRRVAGELLAPEEAPVQGGRKALAHQAKPRLRERQRQHAQELYRAR